MKKILFSILTIVAILLTGCEESETNNRDNSKLVIKAGSICGWGSGTDTIEISHKSVKYVSYIPRLSNQPQVSKIRTLDNDEWSEILSVVNFDDFAKLNYNTCNVCFDGCDEWILLKNDNTSHKITYTKGEKIDTITKLQVKLAQLRTEFNNSYKSIGKITGPDYGMCACCGGWHIVIDDTIYNFDTLPNNSNIILKTATFPINVKLDWQLNDTGCSKWITIQRIVPE